MTTSRPREYETHWRMNPVTRAVFDRVTDAAVAALGPGGPEGHTVLDIGCGSQSNVVFPTATRVIGVDVDEDGLARNATVTEAMLVSINDLDLERSSADAIACIFVLEHVQAPDVVFGRLVRALRPGVVCWWWPFRRFGLRRRWSRATRPSGSTSGSTAVSWVVTR